MWKFLRFRSLIVGTLVASATCPVWADSTAVFNEIMYHPPSTNEALLEWVELHNQMAVDLDISGWSLAGGISFTFPEGTVFPGGGYLVIASSPVDLRAATGITNIIGPFAGRLANGGDTLELRNNNHRLMDSVAYGTDGDWPVAADGSGVSLAKRSPSLGSADARNWTISRVVGGTPGVANVPSTRATTVTRNLVPIEQTWRYDQTGVDFGTSWAQPGFNDSAWSSGAGLLSVEDCGCLPEPIRTPLTLGRTNYYFRTTFNYTGDPSQAALQVKYVVDDGMVLYLNGQEISRIGMPEGPVNYFTFATRGVGNAIYEGPFTVPATALVSGINVLAAEVHQASAGSSDITFGLALDEARTIGGSNSAQAGSIPLAFNEIASSTNASFWVELINYGATNIPLDGFVITRLGGAYREYIFPPQSLAPGQIAAVTSATLGFAADAGDKLFLYAPGRTNVVDAVVAKRNPAARMPNGKGEWMIPTQITPGASNIVSLHNEIVFNEIMYDHRPLPASPASYAPTNVLISITNKWRYDQQGLDLGTSWRDSAYIDGSWQSGTALLYVTTSVLPAPKITPLRLTNSAGARLITWYFRTPFVFTGDLASAILLLRPIVDDGAVFYLNGVEVHRYNMPSGDISYNTLASAGVATPAYTGPVSLPIDSLVIGTNLLAVEVHQFTTNALGADVVFGAELSASSFLSPAQPQRPSPESWIELYNTSTNTISLAGWELDGGIDYSFETNQVIAPGGYLVVAKDLPHMLSLYPSLNLAGPFNNNLSGSSDRLRLRDPLGNIADEVRYYSSGRWPAYANGAGSTLELRDPRADNAQPEAWAASDESAKTGWNTYTYRGVASAEAAASPTTWKEFVLGLLDAGEVLLDDISVIESPAGSPVQFIQNGNFENGMAAWRILGNHSGSVIVDPSNGGNHVLKLVASGATEHMHNHVETTFANNAQVINGREYEISFRAKWLAGNNDVLTRLYFNRLPRVTSLVIPSLSGTPGARNSRYATNIGPTFAGFHHAPVTPAAGQQVSVSVTPADPDGVSALTLWWSANGGAWAQAAMAAQASGEWLGTIPGNPASALVQFYVEGTDSRGARSTFPAAGTNSRALYKVNDGAATFDRLHNLRLLMTADDSARLHAPTNVMSNQLLGTTVVYDEEEPYYDISLHLQGSERGRNDGSRVGFTIRFDPDHLFRGVHDLISIDRSGGYSGLGGKHDEILAKHAINHAGGLPGMYDDLIHVLAPRAQENSTGLLLMAKYGDVFLDSQFKNGGDGSLFKLELIYYPSSTSDGTPEGFKLPNPDQVLATDFRDLGDDKEAYRWNFLKENHGARDDFDGIMALGKTLGLTGSALDAASRRTMDVNEWLRAFALESLFGVVDSYSYGLEHNLMVFIRPEDQKALAFNWDMDFDFTASTSAALVGGDNIAKVINLPGNLRLYYSHLYDLINTTVNPAYMSRWTTHYGSLLGQNWSGALGYITTRRNYVLSQLPTAMAFAITANGGNNFAVSSNLVTLTGTAPIQLESILVNGINYAPTWTSTTDWTLRLPVGFGTNLLSLRGVDRYGSILTNLTDTIYVTNSSPVPGPQGFVVINEIMYHPAIKGSDYVEFHNTHPTVAFDLSRWRLNGTDFVFPDGSVLLPGGFLVVASDTNVFALTYTNAPLPIGQYGGNLQEGGETLTLFRPLGLGGEEAVDAVRYDEQAPWPAAADGFGPSLQLIDPLQDNTRVLNWAAAAPTPGAPNAVRAALPAFPAVWLNEVLAFNANGVADNFGQREPWIELFNPSSNTVSLAGVFLTDNLSNLTQWPFPAGASLAPGEFHIVWCDGQAAQTAGAQWHTSFRLTNSAGTLALVRTNGAASQVLDHMGYFGLTPDRSFGSYPDGQSISRQIFFFVTPGASNNPASAPQPVIINEWMADNTGPAGLRDPADGLFQDWFELYNPNTNAFDLSGYFLTDDLLNNIKWQIPINTVIPPRGFLLVWADNQPFQNTNGNGDLHAGFQLNNGGEDIGLFAPNHAFQSGVSFSSQTENVSQGRFPDGNTNGFYFMTNWTPRATNTLSALPPPGIGSIVVTGTNVAFVVGSIPNRAYRVEYKDALQAPLWIPLSTNRAVNGSVIINDKTTNSQRFYRALLLQ